MVTAKETIAVAGDAAIERIADRARNSCAEASQERPRRGTVTEHEESSLRTGKQLFVWRLVVKDHDDRVILNSIEPMAPQDVERARTL